MSKEIGFSQLAEMNVKDANKIEQGYSGLPEERRKLTFGMKKEENFAEKLVEVIKNGC